MIKYYIKKLKCKFGYHEYTHTTTIANLDNYWMQGGFECVACHHKKISHEDASNLIGFAYAKGVADARNSLLAYGRGVGEIVKIYDKEYVQKILNKLQ